MKLDAGITREHEGIQGLSWNILGQTYVPKLVCDNAFTWYAEFPPGTFVPPHVHPTQDELIYVLEGVLDLELGGARTQARAGDLVRMPRGVPHAYHNR